MQGEGKGGTAWIRKAMFLQDMTYDYYQKVILSLSRQEVGKTEDSQTIWRCRICGYEYVGEELPDDFICPLCKCTRHQILKK